MGFITIDDKQVYEIKLFAAGGRKWAFTMQPGTKPIAVLYVCLGGHPKGWYYRWYRGEYITSPHKRLIEIWGKMTAHDRCGYIYNADAAFRPYGAAR